MVKAESKHALHEYFTCIVVAAVNVYIRSCMIFFLSSRSSIFHTPACIMDTTKNTVSFSRLTVMMLTLVQGINSMPVPTDIPLCTASETAQYSLTFTGKWTQAAFPKQYPVYRPPAQWSNLIGKLCVVLTVMLF